MEVVLFTKRLHGVILELWKRQIISHTLQFGKGKRFVCGRLNHPIGKLIFEMDQDEEQARALYFVPFPPSQNGSKRFAEEAASKKTEGDNFRFVIENREKEVVGDITTHYCNPRNGSFSWGITIKREHRRKGYATNPFSSLCVTIFKNSAIKRSL